MISSWIKLKWGVKGTSKTKKAPALNKCKIKVEKGTPCLIWVQVFNWL